MPEIESETESEKNREELELRKIPFKGIYTEAARLGRLAFFEKETGVVLPTVAQTAVKSEAVRHNIENFLGTVQTPVGAAGPLLINRSSKTEYIYAPLATTEGALVASVIRGAKALSLSGGVTVRALSQQMTRAPFFEFENIDQALEFKTWVQNHFAKIAEKAREYSNHAELCEVKPAVLGKTLHLRFIYRTGDAAGQNMTTACTWNTCQWIMASVNETLGLAPQEFVLEGNLSSDKKVSALATSEGRGIQVCVEAIVKRDVLKQVLKMDPAKLVNSYNRGQSARIFSGMQAFNINVANVVAAIFAATGQDLACVHESSVAQLHLEGHGEDLYMSLYMPSLVVGTVGGGVALPTQRECLELMGCFGQGKSFRLAENIAAFALALDLSTICAMVSGEFAEAHERLGRNRGKAWLKRAELQEPFFQNLLASSLEPGEKIVKVQSLKNFRAGDGIIIDSASQVTRRFCGLLPYEVQTEIGGVFKNCRLLLKIKPIDEEVLFATEMMAKMSDEKLGDLAKKFRAQSPFAGCHVREIEMARIEDQRMISIAPKILGLLRDDQREIYILAQELLENVELMNSADDVSGWTKAHLHAAIDGIAGFHSIHFRKPSILSIGFSHDATSMLQAQDYWLALADHARREFPHWFTRSAFKKQEILISEVGHWWKQLEELPRTIIHNDFNPRNIAFRVAANGSPMLCAYDWELACQQVPQRDLAELLAFTLSETASEAEIRELVERHRLALERLTGQTLEAGAWRLGFKLSLYDFLVNRLSMYMVAHSHRECGFIERVFKVTHHLISVEEAWGN